MSNDNKARIWIIGTLTQLAAFENYIGQDPDLNPTTTKGTLYLCTHDVTPKLIETARAFQLEPQILSAKATHKQPAHNKGRRADWWDHSKAAILDHFADGQWFTAGQVKAITGILRPSRLLTSMYHKGLLQREGIKKGTRYRVAPQKGENDNG